VGTSWCRYFIKLFFIIFPVGSLPLLGLCVTISTLHCDLFPIFERGLFVSYSHLYTLKEFVVNSKRPCKAHRYKFGKYKNSYLWKRLGRRIYFSCFI
jgi:hypothetical protein